MTKVRPRNGRKLAQVHETSLKNLNYKISTNWHDWCKKGNKVQMQWHMQTSDTFGNDVVIRLLKH